MPLPHPRAGGKVAFQPASCYSRGLWGSSPLCPVYIFHITYEAMSLSLFGGLKKKKIAREAPSLVQSTCPPRRGRIAREGKLPAQAREGESSAQGHTALGCPAFTGTSKVLSGSSEAALPLALKGL